LQVNQEKNIFTYGVSVHATGPNGLAAAGSGPAEDGAFFG
jgi:hypothetical protein